MLQLSRANEIVRRSQIIEMTNEASAEAMLAWIMPCKEEFGDSQIIAMSEWRAELAPAHPGERDCSATFIYGEICHM